MKKLILFIIFSLVLSSAVFAQPGHEWNWVKHEWGPVLKKGEAGSWDAGTVAWPSVLYLDGMYHMWYVGIPNYGIGYATSSDGISWTKYENNPVMYKGGSVENEHLILAVNVIHDGEKFQMWYNRMWNNNLEGDIGHATSSDGINWDKDTLNPVVSRSPAGSWDQYCAWAPCVIIEDGIYRMWYSGFQNIVMTSNGQVGYAWHDQSDGIFTKNLDPCMPLLPTENSIWGASIVKGDDYHYMWYTEGPWDDIDLRIRYAYSEDGMNWIRPMGNLAIGKGENDSWESKLVGFCSVVYDEAEEKYKMWYSGSDDYDTWQIGYAEADDPTITSVDESDTVPEIFSLSQNYPNPFNPATMIKYSLPASSWQSAVGSSNRGNSQSTNLSRRSNTKPDHPINQSSSGGLLSVQLVVYDVLGRELATLVKQHQRPGNYQVKWDATGQVSGIYFYKLTAGSFTESKKMLLVK